MKNGNIRLVTDEAPSRLLQKHSPARRHLADLINRKLSIESTLRHLVEAGDKLREAADAERHAAAALVALDAKETRAMSAWSQGSTGPMPVFDRTRRAKLEEEVAAAAALAAAARKAAAENGAAQQRELMALKGLEPPFAIAIAEVIDETVSPLLADYEAANKVLASKAARIQAACTTIRAVAESVGNPTAARPAYVTLEQLSEKIRSMSARVAPDGVNHGTAWNALAARLRSDPLSTLEH
jgi:hypothetical protein